MPYINVRLIQDELTTEQKTAIIRGVTNVMVEVLGKNPETTFVVIDQISSDDWGVGGTSVTERAKARAAQK